MFPARHCNREQSVAGSKSIIPVPPSVIASVAKQSSLNSHDKTTLVSLADFSGGLLWIATRHPAARDDAGGLIALLCRRLKLSHLSRSMARKPEIPRLHVPSASLQPRAKRCGKQSIIPVPPSVIASVAKQSSLNSHDKTTLVSLADFSGGLLWIATRHPAARDDAGGLIALLCRRLKLSHLSRSMARKPEIPRLHVPSASLQPRAKRCGKQSIIPVPPSVIASVAKQSSFKHHPSITPPTMDRDAAYRRS